MNIFRIILPLLSLALALSAQASPLQPWDGYECSQINQPDGKKIGAVCYGTDYDLQVDTIDVYYFGYLYENSADYNYYYVNLSVGGSFFARRGLKKEIFGDGNNLPKTEVLHGRYIVSTNFDHTSLKDKPYAIYFQAEQVHPTQSPPFAYDNLFGSNYKGSIKHF